MTSHRADRRSPATQTVPAGSGAQETPVNPPGKRRAVKPTRAAARAAAAPHLTLDPKLDATPVRVASRQHAGRRKKLFRALPSSPTLVGVAALALAATGATMSQQDTAPAAADFEKFASQASVLNAASSMGSSDALSGRARAVSRDSARMEAQDAEDAELQAAAETQAKKRNKALAALAESAEKHADELSSNAWSLPISAGGYRLTSRFGECSYLWSSCHTGLDFAAPTGTPIYSVAGGVVTETGYDGAYGNKTVVTLDDGTEVWYCHQNSIDVAVGARVSSGQQIGTVGSTGNSTGPHLHLEVRPGAGDPVDPYSAAANQGLGF